MARKKPELSVVGSPPSGTEPPPKSSGVKLWERIMDEHHLSRAGDLELLKQVCVMTDRADMLAQQIETDGAVLYLGDSQMPKAHPALRDEVAARAFVTRTLTRLGVVGDPSEKKKPVGRPATGAGCGITYEQLRDLK